MRAWGSWLVLALLALGCSASLRAAGPVSVVMEDGTVVKGTLLGVDQGTLTVQKGNGKTVDLAQDQVKKVFDADGKSVALPASGGTDEDEAVAPRAKASAAKAAVDEDEEASQVVPRDSRAGRGRGPRRSSGSLQGRKVAGNVLFWTGTAFVVVGVVAMGYGVGQEADATSVYYDGTGYNSSGDYVGYTIDGYPGYYTYDQYSEYYYGQDWVYTGAVVTTVGVIGVVAGLIIRPSGRELRQDALLHYGDGKFSLGIPPVTVDARLHSPRATLATIQF